MRRLSSILKPNISTNVHVTLAAKVARDGSSGWSGQASSGVRRPLGSQGERARAGSNLLLDKVEKL